MGIFDLPAPLLAMIDHALVAAGLPGWARLIVWSALSSAAAMSLYRVLSAQQRLADLKARTAAVRREMRAYDGDFAGLWPLLVRSIDLSARQVGRSLVPSVVGSVPVLLVVAWLGGAYAFALPEPGERVEVRITPANVATRWQPARPAADVAGSVAWPRADRGLVDAEGVHLLSLPLEHPVPVVHKRAWWNGLFGNPAGYLPETTAVELVEIGLPRERYLDIGPAPLGRWETIYFAALISLSLALKVAFRIQ